MRYFFVWIVETGAMVFVTTPSPMQNSVRGKQTNTPAPGSCKQREETRWPLQWCSGGKERYQNKVGHKFSDPHLPW